jgi:serine/threonine-protein kinase ULK/ATG1
MRFNKDLDQVASRLVSSKCALHCNSTEEHNGKTIHSSDPFSFLLSTFIPWLPPCSPCHRFVPAVYKGVKVQSSEAGESSTTTEALTDVVAIKAINRTSEKLTKKVLDNLEQEISILRTYKHRNIVCMTDVVKTDRHYYLILEYCGGGDVQRLIRTRKAGRLSERLARRLMRDLAAGLKFLWNQELIHRDIKPQNLLLTGPLPLDEVNDPATLDVHDEMRQAADFPSELFALKIADFGFARHLQSASLAETLCGSPLYMAPEILQHQR